MIKTTKVYAHTDGDYMYNKGEEMGLEGGH